VKDTLARHYDIEAEPKYSLHRISKSRKVLRKLLVEDLQVTNRLVVGKLLGDVCHYMVHHWLSKPGDYDNPYKAWQAEYMGAQANIDSLYAVRRDALRSIFLEYMDDAWTIDIVGRICGHLAGWEDELKEGIHIPRWNPNQFVWAPLYIRSCELTYPSKGRRMYAVDAVSLAGPTVTMSWQFNASPARLQALMREAGLPRFEEKQADDFGGLHVTVLLRELDRQMHMSDHHVTAAQSKANKELYKARLRGCTGAFPPLAGQACRACPIGRDKCALSRIQEGFYITKECKNGHTGFFRRVSDPYCFLCFLKGQAKKDR